MTMNNREKAINEVKRIDDATIYNWQDEMIANIESIYQGYFDDEE